MNNNYKIYYNNKNKTNKNNKNNKNKIHIVKINYKN